MLRLLRNPARTAVLLDSLQHQQHRFARATPPLPVILQQEVHKLGKAGDHVRVNQGFAHNWLLPRGKAIYDLKANFGGRKRKLEKDHRAEASPNAGPSASASAEQLQLQRVMERLLSQPVVVKRKFRRGEILEGQVTRGTIVDAIARQRKVQMVPEMIEMSAPILRHGIYDIPLGIRMPDGQPVMLEVIVRTP